MYAHGLMIQKKYQIGIIETKLRKRRSKKRKKKAGSVTQCEFELENFILQGL